MEALRIRRIAPAARWIEVAAVLGAVAYVVALGWAMARTTYDVWGALVIIPVLIGVTAAVLRSVFRDPWLYRAAMVGLLAKFAATFARYWVVFEAYGGLGDARRYHLAGTDIARAVRGGEQTFLSALPHGVGTEFVDGLTGFIYTLFGGSQLAGFFWFSWLGYWGLVLYVKAAEIGLPSIDLRRYALLVFLAPTLIFWPSSIGKEAWMMPCLALLTWGIARALNGVWRGRSLLAIAAGTIGASFVRPHQAAIWLGALLLAVIVSTGRSSKRVGRAGGRVYTVVMTVIGGVVLVIVGRVTLSYLAGAGDDPTAGITDRIGGLFDENSRRSTGGGSSFTPPSIASPLQWPSAIFQTLFRPFILRARGLSQLIPAVESTFILGLGIVGYRRFKGFFRALRQSSFLAFCLLAVMGFGLAFSTFGNLAILVRQRSLAYPLLLVLFCLPRPPLAGRLPLDVDTTWRRSTEPV